MFWLVNLDCLSDFAVTLDEVIVGTYHTLGRFMYQYDRVYKYAPARLWASVFYIIHRHTNLDLLAEVLRQNIGRYNFNIELICHCPCAENWRIT